MSICIASENIIIYEERETHRISFPTKPSPTLPNKPILIPLQYTLLLKLKMGWFGRVYFQFQSYMYTAYGMYNV